VKDSFLSFINEVITKFISGLPDVTSVFVLLVIFTAWAFLCSQVAAYLKTKKALRTGYTRKAYHFLIFISAAVINLLFGFTGVCLFGIIVSCFIFYALLKRKASGLYLALARETDFPNSTLYIIIPYLSTLMGGILINYFFPEFVIIGYLICGIGDASGEVLGTKYGKHTFKVKLANIHQSVKSLEGSGSIFIISFLIYTGYSILTHQAFNLSMMGYIFLSSLIVTVAEIITPKGFDNLTIQIIAILAYLHLIL
jgi:phytol kinase